MRPSIDELVQLYDPFIRRKIFLMIQEYPNSVDLAHDLTNDVWVKVCRSYLKMPDDTNFGGWIVTIARTTTIDYIRRFKRIDARHISNDILLSCEDVLPTPEEQFIQIEAINETFSHLQPVDAIVCRLHSEGVPNKEIPDILKEKTGKSYRKSGVKMLVSRATHSFEVAYQHL